MMRVRVRVSLATDPVAKDPVCGMSVEPQSAAARRVYGGRTFYFCAKGCAEAFDREPKKYLGGRGSRDHAAANRAPSPQPPPSVRGRKQTPLFEIKAPAGSSFLRKPPVKPGVPPDSQPMVFPPATTRVALAVDGMHCASCVSTIEGTLLGVTGVSEASVNLATGRADVIGRGLNARRLIEAVRTSGYDARLAGEEIPGQKEDRAQREVRLVLRRTLLSAALTLPALV